MCQKHGYVFCIDQRPKQSLEKQEVSSPEKQLHRREVFPSALPLDGFLSLDFLPKKRDGSSEVLRQETSSVEYMFLYFFAVT